MISYKQGKENIVVDVLLKRYVLLSTLNTKLLGFEFVKDLFIEDFDFDQVYVLCEHLAFDKFYRIDGYIFKEKRLCVLNYFLYELLVCEAYLDRLMRHFGVAKTLDILH